MKTDHEQDWTCRTCGTTYVVPALARACEARHEEEDEQ